jgi:hypothetical protein
MAFDRLRHIIQFDKFGMVMNIIMILSIAMGLNRWLLNFNGCLTFLFERR